MAIIFHKIKELQQSATGCTNMSTSYTSENIVPAGMEGAEPTHVEA